MPDTTAVVRRPEQVPGDLVAPGVTAAHMLNDEHGCRGLHQRRLRIGGGATLAGVAGGRGEAWYVIRGSGVLEAGAAGTRGTGEQDVAVGTSGTLELEPGTAVWLAPGLGYRARAEAGRTEAGRTEGDGAEAGGGDLEVLAITVRAEAAEGPGLHAVRLADCAVERTGDREFRVLLSAGLSITQFAGMIPPGRAPEHQHTYDEVVHVLAGQGVVHLGEEDTEIGPGTSIYLPPGQPHCLENTGTETLQVLGVFYPAGSPAAKREG
jgi:mannose-6-phosphate isomerase-like protein (cupin superfamily)